jgi:hypothetical protein
MIMLSYGYMERWLFVFCHDISLTEAKNVKCSTGRESAKQQDCCAADGTAQSPSTNTKKLCYVQIRIARRRKKFFNSQLKYEQFETHQIKYKENWQNVI